MMQALDGLKDIHLPAPVSWWHLAWGWWLLLFLFVMLGVLLWLKLPSLRAWYQKQREYRALKKDVRAAFTAMRTAYDKEHDGLALLQAISILLRRIAISVFARQQSAGLIDDDWLQFLDAQWGNSKPAQGFCDKKNAELLKYHVYCREIDKKLHQDIKKLLDLSEKWADKVLKSYV